MNDFVVITDSTNDLPIEILNKYNVEVLPLLINIGENSYKDGVELNTVELFDLSEKAKALPKTSAVSPAVFIETFKKNIELGKKVLFIGIGSGFSATIQNANIALEDFKKDVFLVDSEKLTIGLGFVVIKACELRAAGKSIEETVETLNIYKKLVRTYFAISTLEYLHKGGRCSGTARLFSAMLKIFPIIRVAENQMEVAKKPRGRFENALNVLLEYLDKDIESGNIDFNKIALIYPHPKALDDLDYMKKALEKRQIKDFLITTAGCTIASHCGPRTIGLAYMVKE